MKISTVWWKLHSEGPSLLGVWMFPLTDINVTVKAGYYYSVYSKVTYILYFHLLTVTLCG